MDNQYQQQSWQQPYPPNTQPTQPMSPTGQSSTVQSHQFYAPQMQGATYASSTSTTTQQQTTMTTSNQLNNTYMPAYQQTASSNPQYPGQPQELLYQQQAVSHWPHETQQPLVLQPQPAPAPASAPASQQVPLQYQQQSQVVQSYETQQSPVPQPPPAPAPQQVPLQYQQQSQIVQSLESQQFLVPQPSPTPAPQQVPLQYQQQHQQVFQSSSQPPLITQDLPQHQQQPMLQYPQPQVSSQPPLLDGLQPRTIDFSQLVQSPPRPQQSTPNDFSQLMQATPPANATSSVITTTTTHSKKTETYKGANAGGKARKEAESKGDVEVQRFESKVQKLIKDIGVCPMGRPWYNSFEGYMCGEGIHFLYHKDIDKALKKPGWLPQVTWVNTWDDPEAQNSGLFFAMHPPQIAFDQPMHRMHAEFLRTSKLMGCQTGEESKKKSKLQGCTAECFRGAELIPKEEVKRLSRAQGFDPNATRHAMFI